MDFFSSYRPSSPFVPFYLFIIFCLSPSTVPRQFFLPSSSPSSNIQTLFSKSQTQKSWSQNRSKNPNPKFTISGSKRHGFDDLSIGVVWVCWSRHQRSVFCVFWFGLSLDSFSVFSRLVLRWNIFCCGFVFSGLISKCFLGWCFGFFFSFLVALFLFFGLLFCAVLSCCIWFLVAAFCDFWLFWVSALVISIFWFLVVAFSGFCVGDFWLIFWFLLCWVFSVRYFANVNRVSKTRFLGGRYVEKVSIQTWSEPENRASKTRFIGPKSSFWNSRCY